MAIDIKSPQFPESIFEGTLSTWLKKEGQEIKQDEVLAEIETCLLYTSPSPRDKRQSRMPSSA